MSALYIFINKLFIILDNDSYNLIKGGKLKT